MPLFRRSFLMRAGVALFGLGVAPHFLSRALAATGGDPKKSLVVLFMRGGADGLSLVPPHGDANYYRMRPTLALPPPGQTDGVLALDTHFGLHPALAELLPCWNAGTLALVHGVGMPHGTRSHFDAQDFLETGTPGLKSTADGWLNRSLSALSGADTSAFAAVALQPTLPRSLVGAAPALSMGALRDFKLQARGTEGGRSFTELYSGSVDSALQRTGSEALDALDMVASRKLANAPALHGASYGKDALAQRLQDIARLIRGDVGLRIAATEVGGWDTHVNQGGAAGQLANQLKKLGAALAAFERDLGAKMADVTVVAVTEFGRTVRENGNRGTDHGTGSLMLVLGGGVRGKRVLGGVPELREEALFEGRDVPMAVDFRQAFWEVARAQLGLASPAHIFPDFHPSSPLGLMGG